MTYAPDQTAVVLIDPFNDFLSEGGKLWPFTRETVTGSGMIGNLKALLTAARAHGIRIVYAPHHHTTPGDYLNWRILSPSHRGSLQTTLFEKHSWGAEFHPDLVPQTGDLVASNHWTASGFANTDLDFMLRQHGISNIVLAGMRANTCIDSTARYGVELGYHVTLIKDGIAAFAWEEIEATVNITFPNYGHAIASTQEFINTLTPKA